MKLLGEATRAPEPHERAKERSLFFTLLADIGITLLQIVFALATGSLTMLSEAVRAVLVTLVDIYSLWLLGGIHRGRLGHFQFGVAKIEQFVWMIIGLCLVLSGLWIAEKVVVSAFDPQFVPSPLGLACVAVVNAINLTINALAFYGMVAASGDNDSNIFRAQLRARAVKLVNSVFLQVTLTIAALSTDPVIALLMDGLGALFVSCLMVVSGTSMMGSALPDLLDAPLHETLRARIAKTIGETRAAAGDVVDIHTRRSGRFPQVEVTLDAGRFSTVAALHDRIAEIRDAVRRLDNQVEPTIVLSGNKPSTG